MDKIIIYSDGGCRGNGKDNTIGGYGIVLLYKDLVKEIKGGERNTTNNRMELMAVIVGLQTLKEWVKYPIEICSDSAYVVNCMNNKWYKKWETNGWKTSQKTQVENRDLWETLIDLVESHGNVTFFKVRGHDGDKWNERADELCNEYMDELEKGE